MIYPNFLKQGDVIGVPAPSNGARDELKIYRYQNAKQKIENLGYKVIVSKNINISKKARSAPAKERAEELNQMFENRDIDFISCASGGEFFTCSR